MRAVFLFSILLVGTLVMSFPAGNQADVAKSDMRHDAWVETTRGCLGLFAENYHTPHVQARTKKHLDGLPDVAVSLDDNDTVIVQVLAGTKVVLMTVAEK